MTQIEDIDTLERVLDGLLASLSGSDSMAVL